MSRFDQLREQIDACRSDSRDLAAPELAELSQAVERDPDVASELSRSQGWDKAIGNALADVPIPPGLAERLLAAVEAAAEVEAGAGELQIAEAEPVALAKSAAPGQLRVSRRQLLVGGSIALSMAALGVALYRGLQPVKIVTQQQLSGAVESWLTRLEPTAWTLLEGGRYPRGTEPDKAVRVRAQASQAFRFSADEWTANVTAIDLAPPGRSAKAVLFVVRSSARFIVPPNPSSNMGLGLSRRMKAISWQRMDSPWLYVLAVEEVGGQKLEHYLQATHYTGHELQASDQPL